LSRNLVLVTFISQLVVVVFIVLLSLFEGHIKKIIYSYDSHNECVLFHNLTDLDRSEQNAPRSFSPDCINLVLI